MIAPQAEGEQQADFPGHEGTVVGLAWLAERVLASASGTDLRLLEIGREGFAAVQRLSSPILVLAASPDGLVLATGHHDRAVRFWDHSSGEVAETGRFPSKVRQLAWNGAGRDLAAAGGPAVTVWEFNLVGTEDSLPESVVSVPAPVSGLAFARERMVAVTQSGDLRIWQVHPEWELALKDHVDAELFGLTVSTNERWVAAATTDARIIGWTI